MGSSQRLHHMRMSSSRYPRAGYEAALSRGNSVKCGCSWSANCKLQMKAAGQQGRLACGSTAKPAS